MTSTTVGILVRFQKYFEMVLLQPIVIKRFRLRALLVIAALISLCASNNVGTSFLPLSSAIDSVAANLKEHQRERASQPLSPVESDSFRVPIMSQKRADKETQPQHLASTLTSGLVTPTGVHIATEFSYSSSFFTSVFMARPPGRAPPRFIQA